MARTVVFAEAPDVVIDWLERRRALGRDGHDVMWTVEWYTRGAECVERTGASRLLGVDEATLHAEIDWPPSA